MAMRAGGGDDLNSEINVTPLVDVMLVLLIIFMITAPMLNTGVELTLPEVTAQKIEDPEGLLILTIDAERKITLGKTPIAWKDLREKLEKNEKAQKDDKIHLAAHGALPYSVVATAMAIAKDAGIGKVLLLTDPTEYLDLKELDAPGAASKTP